MQPHELEQLPAAIHVCDWLSTGWTSKLHASGQAWCFVVILCWLLLLPGRYSRMMVELQRLSMSVKGDLNHGA